jgi:hypothetical protein
VLHNLFLRKNWCQRQWTIAASICITGTFLSCQCVIGWHSADVPQPPSRRKESQHQEKLAPVYSYYSLHTSLKGGQEGERGWEKKTPPISLGYFSRRSYELAGVKSLYMLKFQTIWEDIFAPSTRKEILLPSSLSKTNPRLKFPHQCLSLD